MDQEDPDHPILSKPWSYEVDALSIELAPDDGGEARLDLRLSRAGETVRLRFWSPSEVEASWPLTSHGLRILDLAGRGLEIGVQVADFEEQSGGIEFYARAVERLGSRGRVPKAPSRASDGVGPVRTSPDAAELVRENELVCALVQASLGSITPNMRAIAIEFVSGGVCLHFVLSVDERDDRDEISDIVSEFDALLSVSTDIEVAVRVSPRGEALRSLPGCPVYVRRDAF